METKFEINLTNQSVICKGLLRTLAISCLFPSLVVLPAQTLNGSNDSSTMSPKNKLNLNEVPD